MKKLFLASVARNTLNKFVDSLDSLPSSLKVAFVPTAGNILEANWFVTEDRNKLIDLGFNVINVNLEGKTKNQLSEEMNDIDIVFRSTKDSIQQTIHRINLVDPISNYEYVIVGNYDPEDGSIHFNIGSDDIPGDELARVLTHELVHMLQDDMGKFPEMGKKKKVNSSGVDVESPWEVEAYKIQKELFPDFLADCKIY